MHKKVALSLKRLGDQINIKIALGEDSSNWLSVGSGNNDKVGSPTVGSAGNTGSDVSPSNPLSRAQSEDAENNTPSDTEADQPTSHSFQAVYDQIMDSCDSLVPMEISDAFSLIDSRFVLMGLANEETQNALKKSIGSHVTPRIMEAAFNELFDVFSGTAFWPCCPLNADHAFNRVATRVHHMICQSNGTFSNDKSVSFPEDFASYSSRLCYKFWCCCCHKCVPPYGAVDERLPLINNE
mmetsp:Transcript_7989/g.12054  ORF Transcript_7989/g.12054 Transcript_7989/m.12054 type:complete len:239 (-) Transcript_7989:37-753(-)